MAATTTTTSTGSAFLNLRSSNRLRSPPSSPPGGCGKLDGVAMWFINGVSTAFFASLERCSCIRVATEDDGEDSNDAPLILHDGNLRRDAGSASRRRNNSSKTKKNNIAGGGGVLADDDI